MNIIKKNVLNILHSLIGLVALFLCGCDEIPEHCGNYELRDPFKQFCYEGKTMDKCGGVEYNPITHGCEGGVVKSIAEMVFNDMVLVDGGTFTMGCTEEQGDGYCNNEKPAHNVTLSSYYIGKYEITQEQWRAVTGDSFNRCIDDNYYSAYSHCVDVDNAPIDMVDWNRLQEFIKKLNSATGKKYRLPTEAEWEYAARGGSNSNDYKYSGSNNLDDVAWTFLGRHTVGTKAPNDLGIYDMSGNISEYVSDWYSGYSGNPLMNPKGPTSGSNHVVRGGDYSWSYDGAFRVYSRHDIPAGGCCFSGIGFRLAMSP